MSDNASVKAKVAAYLLLAQEIKELKASQDRIKTELNPYLDEAETNSRGSYVLPFSEPLEIGGQRYKELQRVRKESKVLDEEKVIEWAYQVLTEKQRDELIVTSQHVDQDVLWDLYVNEELTKEELDSFFNVTVTWAFQPTKE